VSADGRRALGFSASGLALFDGVWRRVELPPNVFAGDVSCATATSDGGFVAAGRGALVLTFDANGTAKRIGLKLPDPHNVTFLGACAESASSFDLVGAARDGGIVASISGERAGILPCISSLSGAARRGAFVFVCGPAGVMGVVDPGGRLRLYPRVGTRLAAVAVDSKAAYACGLGAYIYSFHEDQPPKLMAVQTAQPLVTLSVFRDETWVASEGGRFLRREGEQWIRKSPDLASSVRVRALFVAPDRLTAIVATGAVITATPRRG
jgi:hypothetical protein